MFFFQEFDMKRGEQRGLLSFLYFLLCYLNVIAYGGRFCGWDGMGRKQPAFLRGQTRQSRELSPVRIVANPDGSMQRSALQQVQMAKERRELRQAQANQVIDRSTFSYFRKYG